MCCANATGSSDAELGVAGGGVATACAAVGADDGGDAIDAGMYAALVMVMCHRRDDAARSVMLVARAV